MIEGQNPRDQLLVIQVPNARDQIAFYAVHSLVVDVQMLATYMPRMRNSNLELSISSNQGKQIVVEIPICVCGYHRRTCVMSRGFNVKMRQVACVKFYGKENGPIFIPPPQKKMVVLSSPSLFFYYHVSGQKLYPY